KDNRVHRSTSANGLLNGRASSGPVQSLSPAGRGEEPWARLKTLNAGSPRLEIEPRRTRGGGGGAAAKKPSGGDEGSPAGVPKHTQVRGLAWVLAEEGRAEGLLVGPSCRSRGSPGTQAPRPPGLGRAVPRRGRGGTEPGCSPRRLRRSRRT